MQASIRVTPFARIIGQAFIKIPYISQNKTPTVKRTNITSEISFVERVCQTLITCGRNDIVVKNPPIIPLIATKSILIKSSQN
jgi:hypothetical protein